MLKITTKFFKIEGDDAKEVVKALEAFIETPAMKKIQEAYEIFIDEMYESPNIEIKAHASRYETMETGESIAPIVAPAKSTEVPVIIDFESTNKYTYQCRGCKRTVIKRESSSTDSLTCSCGEVKNINNEDFAEVDIICPKCGYLHRGMFVEKGVNFSIRCMECKKDLNAQDYIKQ